MSPKIYLNWIGTGFFVLFTVSKKVAQAAIAQVASCEASNPDTAEFNFSGNASTAYAANEVQHNANSTERARFDTASEAATRRR